MSTILDQIRDRLAEYLNAMGVAAVTAWPAAGRVQNDEVVAVVSIRGCKVEPAGFQNYLGEFYHQETGLWEEWYGRMARLTFGMDLYAPAEAEGEALQTAFLKLAEVLTRGAPEGLEVETVSCGETGYDKDSGKMKRSVQAVCKAWLYAVDRGGQVFLEFELRGGMKT